MKPLTGADHNSCPGVTSHGVHGKERISANPPPRYVRYFFLTMGCLFPIIALVGFAPSYRDLYRGTFPIHWFAHIHGALMSGWLGVFLTQAILAARRRLKLHRQVGQLSVGLGVLVWLSMGVASVRALIGYNPPEDHFLFDVLINQLFGMAEFGLFFTWGMLVRKNADAHKRLLFLATLVLLQAAIDRIHGLPVVDIGYPSDYFLYLDVLLVPLCMYDWLALRRIHPVTWLGTLLLLAAQCSVATVWGSPAWHHFWFNLLQKYQ